jgi:NAD+ synthase
MTRRYLICAAQLNPIMGDIDGNADKVRAARAMAAAKGADIIVFPELMLVGYPPEDLVLKPALVQACQEAVVALADETDDGGPAVIVGTPWIVDGALHNCVLVLDAGKIASVRSKVHLPNYGVFDEARVFKPGPKPKPVRVRGLKIGLPICEDIWFEAVPRQLAAAGAEIIIVPNGSPYRRSIYQERTDAFLTWADIALPYVFINQVGGQDELVFDGASFALDGEGQLVARAPNFEEALLYSAWERTGEGLKGQQGEIAPFSLGVEADYRAAVLALGDYVNKNRFPGVVLGMSGGIDSALTAAMAVDALGPDRVWCVMMPYRYTNTDSLEDAQACAKALGVRYDVIAIEPGVEALSSMLGEQFEGRAPDTTEENIQSRLRAVTLMALSNKFGHMVVTTGNKSEMAVGYATLYGDMCGGYNPLKDLYKTEVFALAHWRNANHPRGALGPTGLVIPERSITKPPSAELRPDQRDDDSLPPYDVLDDILRGLVEGEAEIEAIIARGHDPKTVRRIEHLLYLAEYKRRQAPPGVKIGPKNFGRDRRYPITNRFRDN